MYNLDVHDQDMDEDWKDKFEYNDSWMDSIKEEYYDLTEKADIKLEEIAKSKEKVGDTEQLVWSWLRKKSKEWLRIKGLVAEQEKAEKKSIAVKKIPIEFYSRWRGHVWKAPQCIRWYSWGAE